jgi:hypothetical protein
MESGERLAAADIRVAARVGRVCAAFHLYATTGDVDRAVVVSACPARPDHQPGNQSIFAFRVTPA